MPFVPDSDDVSDVVQDGKIAFVVAMACWWIGGWFGLFFGPLALGYGWIKWELHVRREGAPKPVRESVFLHLLFSCRLAFLVPLACFYFR